MGWAGLCDEYSVHCHPMPPPSSCGIEGNYSNGVKKIKNEGNRTERNKKTLGNVLEDEDEQHASDRLWQQHDGVGETLVTMVSQPPCYDTVSVANITTY